jgi:hypothetical protein
MLSNKYIIIGSRIENSHSFQHDEIVIITKCL